MDNELYHHGIAGQKYSVRRYQKLNGTYTKEGNERYRGKKEQKESKEQKEKSYNKSESSVNTSNIGDLKDLANVLPLSFGLTSLSLFSSLAIDASKKVTEYAKKGYEAVNSSYIKKKITETSINEASGLSNSAKSFLETNKEGLKKFFKKDK